jgi:hypothetical protein
MSPSIECDSYFANPNKLLSFIRCDVSLCTLVRPVATSAKLDEYSLFPRSPFITNFNIIHQSIVLPHGLFLHYHDYNFVPNYHIALASFRAHLIFLGPIRLIIFLYSILQITKTLVTQLSPATCSFSSLRWKYSLYTPFLITFVVFFLR